MAGRGTLADIIGPQHLRLNGGTSVTPRRTLNIIGGSVAMSDDAQANETVLDVGPSVLSPAVLTGVSQVAYDPPGFGDAQVLFLDTNTETWIEYFGELTPSVHVKTLINIGSRSIHLRHIYDYAANGRILCGGDLDREIKPREACTLLWDPTTGAYRVNARRELVIGERGTYTTTFNDRNAWLEAENRLVGDFGIDEPAVLHYLARLHLQSERAGANRIAQMSSWTAQGTASITPNIADPLGTAIGDRVVVNGSGNDVFYAASGYTASAAVAAAIVIKRVSTSGTLRLGNFVGAGYYDIDLSLLGDVPELIDANHPADRQCGVRCGRVRDRVHVPASHRGRTAHHRRVPSDRA